MSSRPKCFGNAVDYDDSPTSRSSCPGCASRLECSNEIQRIQARIPRPVQAPPQYPPHPTQSYTGAPNTQPPYRPAYTGTAAPQYQPVSSQMSYPAPGTYDFEQPIAEQFGAYLGFSFLDTLCVELRHLVGASRSHYMAKRRK